MSDAVPGFYSSLIRQGRTLDFMPTRANGQPELGAYLQAQAGNVRHGTRLLVLTLSGDRICAVTRFEDTVLPWFGLPLSLPG